ncbi:hypothetical protein BDV59DRAFT_199268 [Aspergillus ambiguus]|uniref:uncharacterized protein n=1 Tax=Aspergillus ambiguus TaxID=176160 RepID=UPI003CCE1FE0
MTSVEPLVLYLALHRYINGADAEAPFPGTFKNFIYTNTDSSQDLISKSEIYLSIVKPAEADGNAFNIVDSSDPGSWSRKWPILAVYFGLKDTDSVEDAWSGLDGLLEEYKKMWGKYGLNFRAISPEAWIFVKEGFTLLDRNREMGLDKIRNVGFKEELPVGQGHCKIFDRLWR